MEKDTLPQIPQLYLSQLFIDICKKFKFTSCEPPLASSNGRTNIKGKAATLKMSNKGREWKAVEKRNELNDAFAKKQDKKPDQNKIGEKAGCSLFRASM